MSEANNFIYVPTTCPDLLANRDTTRQGGVNMPGTHKNPTISFRVSEYERKEIEAKIKASGMSKKDYFVKSCIYNRVCVVGKKETIDPLIEELENMQDVIRDVAEQISYNNVTLSEDGMEEMKTEFLDMLKAILWMLDGASYLWEGKEKNRRD